VASVGALLTSGVPTDAKYMEEIWKDVPGYEGQFQASNLGRIKSLKRLGAWVERIRKLHLNKKGNYWEICITDKCGRYFKTMLKVHRMVASAFIPNTEEKPTVNHKDGNRLNNYVENLEWCTQKENMQHAWRTGLISSAKIRAGGRSYEKRISDFSVSQMRNEYRPGLFGYKRLAKKYGISKSLVCAIIKGRKRKASGKAG
jgi:hypothetical protein